MDVDFDFLPELLLSCYAVWSGNCVPTFRDDLSVPYSDGKAVKFVPKCQYGITTPRCIIRQKSANLICIAAEI